MYSDLTTREIAMQRPRAALSQLSVDKPARQAYVSRQSRMAEIPAHGMNRTRLIAAVWCALVFILSLSSVEAQDTNRGAHFQTRSGLHFFAGGAVTVVEQDADDIYAAGGTVSVVSTSAEDLIVAGGSVTFKDIVVEDVVTAGGDIDIDGTLSQDLVATGGMIYVRDTATIGGDAMVSGGELTVNGTIDGSLTAAGSKVWIAANIAGNVDVSGSSIEFAPGTVIGGNLTYRSAGQVDIPPGVTVAGRVTRLEADVDLNTDGESDLGLLGWLLIGLAFWVTGLLALLLFGAVALAVFPGLLSRAAGTLRERPLACLGLGFAVAVSAPIGLVMLMFTLIGVPLALFGFACYAVFMGLALVALCHWAGLTLREVFGRPPAELTLGPRIGWTIVGFVIFMLAGIVPLIGNLAQFLGLTAGFGALAMTAWGDRAPA